MKVLTKKELEQVIRLQEKIDALAEKFKEKPKLKKLAEDAEIRTVEYEDSPIDMLGGASAFLEYIIERNHRED